MSSYLPRTLTVLILLGLIFACSREPDRPAGDLLQHVPADTLYAFVNSRPLPAGLRDKLADHYAARLAAQGPMIAQLRTRIEDSDDTAPMASQAGRLFDVLEALFVEFEGRGTAAGFRELGIEPVTRSVFYGIGLMPVLRFEIADAGRFNAMLDRVEQRAGLSAKRAELDGQAYRRIDLGGFDVVLSVTERHAIAGLLPDTQFDRDLPLLLGKELPSSSLAGSGEIEALIERHGFTGFGEGFLKLDRLLGVVLGKGEGRNAQLMQALGGVPEPVSAGCMEMSEHLVAGMPRLVVGIRTADEDRLATRVVWESAPAVAAVLQKLAAPVPGLGSPYPGLLAVGMGFDLPQLRNAIDTLVRELIASGSACEWVDRERLQAVMPQLNLALGPMTAGINGFNIQVDDLSIDPATLQPVDVSAGLLIAVDDPRGIFALGAMFSPALATLEIPGDGSFVDLPAGLAPGGHTPPLRVAVRDQALVLLAGSQSADVVKTLLGGGGSSPAPLFTIDYGIHQLVQRFGDLVDSAIVQLESRGENEDAAELRDQLAGFRLQAEQFERLQVSMHANAEGLVIDQVMEFR